ncbi:MAG TPA: metallophosphoesterase [Candidatus Hydrogenedentes bacterium]|jgi:3',5'-cyclic AMP phosphodiesterase CpdA|nr:MAG: cyclic 3',5'-adenosine monophosphate phosphodiesterase [Candidatus Hydrogenedentes bacterium ADurb.Bin170]HNZ47277.1 metallophosphoesterase [Candidatus Hydrogenedentota bacterium]HOD95670.1 metallophosphoesterase [Candidatus Hydrogenedentota bacterium]HOH43580.1 metallophosphoesterase [Candidatus Hydrogenedentota bacterium]HOR50637.1 metallophosphoesterase [Candidatus Hydrogenedentota bacterium]
MWRFVHITDPHLASERDGVWNNRFLCSMMPEVMACLKRDLQRLQPEFLIVSGDIVSHNTEEAVLQARDAIESLGFPYYPLGGNHDCYSLESRKWFTDAYAHRLPDSKTYYSFAHKNIRFFALDPWWVHNDGSLSPEADKNAAKRQQTNLNNMRWALPEEQFLWLIKELERTAEKTACAVSHYPFLPVPDRFRRPGYKFGGNLDNGKKISRELAAFPKMKMVLSGHIHTNSIQRFQGIYHVTTSALPEYPVEFRIVDVYRNRWEIKTQALSDSSFAERSLRPGHSYTAGTTRDRQATIYL